MNDRLSSLPLVKANRRTFLSHSLALGASLAGIGTLLQSCGGGNANSNGAIKWSTWAGAKTSKRLQEFTDRYNRDHNANVKFAPIPSYDDYLPKILTQLNGGIAPDVFYAADEHIIKLIQNKTIEELTPLLAKSDSVVKESDYFPGMWGAARTRSGKIYGIPVDCNPIVLWYNKKVLQEAGITEMPAELYKQGKWTRDVFQQMIDKITANKKRGYILASDSMLYHYSWAINNGGRIYDKDGYGDFIADQDPKTVEAFEWLAENVRAKKFAYASSLPSNQSEDLMFTANQVGFLSAGRYYLSTFKGARAKGLDYDIVPMPGTDGKSRPTGIFLAYIVLNKKTKNPAEAYKFLSNYVSKDGETLRLKDAGDAVPSVKGADQVVLDGNDPVHAQHLLDARNTGFATFASEMGTPGLSLDIVSAFDPVFLKGADVKTTLGKVAAMVNPRIKQAQSLLQ
ncbi:multiple sugar transport system substrate-binding protein [Thermosporothrix hazakensis]|jgi:multiple sugar transport system substrate-binding protein|uniref:Multiple sugar transport system substrate-binding protein n=1 Tax=Thermosporothrix hazakensis TaxID=644383 RepID=A0A326U4H6_THEHA|nr:sugar ABC transporter substrate-binding protein [Thermosporothrix hazakensis]PZW26121.1 multiple sugar transport system substrate-binding protein [Thermosporothrix hazakensis]GCE51379.1 ABC transporter substrate-binding protein [Thermosporothrix hazakensis]